MFGHDNQDDQSAEGDHEVQIPTADGSQSLHADDTTTAPLPAAQSADSSNLGGFLPNASEPNDVLPPTDDLLDIKQQALQALSPLVGHLDQTPEEKFRTTMMMIQASDDHSLVRVAYDSAKDIADEKERAQALLDIVNEINYFTQHHQA